jgi:hypothetical protein
MRTEEERLFVGEEIFCSEMSCGQVCERIRVYVEPGSPLRHS